MREQVVACAGEVQTTFTCPVNPFNAFTEITFVNVAVWPAFTVCTPCPAATVNEKSGGPVTVKFTELDDTDVGVTLTTVTGYVPAATPPKMRLVVSCVVPL